MKNKIEEIFEIISQPIDSTGIEELLIQYINQIDNKKDLEDIFGFTFETVYDGELKTSNLIDFAFENNFRKFLCASLEKYPELAEYTQTTDNEFYGDTLGHEAAKKEMEDVCLKILEVASFMVYERDDNGNSFVSICAENGMENVCIQALHAEPNLAQFQFGPLNQTIAHTAAENSLETVVFKSLAIEPNSACIKDSTGKTYMHYSAENLLGKICLRGLELCPESAKIQDDISKETFLHIVASFQKNKDMEKVLLQALEINSELGKIQNFLGDTFLHIAIQNSFEEVFLRANVIAPELTMLKNGDGKTCWDLYKELQEEKQNNKKSKIDYKNDIREKN